MFIHKISKYITIYFSQKSRKRQLLKLANSLFYLLSVAANSAKYQLLIISFQVAWKSVCMPSFSFYHSNVPSFQFANHQMFLSQRDKLFWKALSCFGNHFEALFLILISRSWLKQSLPHVRPGRRPLQEFNNDLKLIQCQCW